MKNKKGEIYVTVCVFLLVIFMIFSVVFTFASAVSLVRTQQANTEIVLDSFVANNSILIYRNIKMGSTAMQNVDTAGFNQMLVRFCALQPDGGKYVCYDPDGKEQFSITVPTVDYIEDQTLELFTTYTMYVPIRFAGVTVTQAVVPLKITSELRSVTDSLITETASYIQVRRAYPYLLPNFLDKQDIFESRVMKIFQKIIHCGACYYILTI